MSVHHLLSFCVAFLVKGQDLWLSKFYRSMISWCAIPAFLNMHVIIGNFKYLLYTLYVRALLDTDAVLNSRHWVWLCRGYWRYRNWLIEKLLVYGIHGFRGVLQIKRVLKISKVAIEIENLVSSVVPPSFDKLQWWLASFQWREVLQCADLTSDPHISSSHLNGVMVFNQWIPVV